MNRQKDIRKQILDKLLGILLLVFLVLYSVSCEKAPGSKTLTIFKMATSVCFTLDAILWIDLKSKKRQRYPMLQMVGIFVMLFADYFILSSFTLGAVLFAIGHFCYLMAFYTLHSFEKSDVVWSGAFAVFSALTLTFLPFLDYQPASMYYVCLGYSVIVSWMAGKSISNYRKMKNSLSLILCIGGVCFFFSDTMVLFDAFATDKWIYTHIGHALYFPAQFILAHGIKKYYEN